jgi:hypothetical protein
MTAGPEQDAATVAINNQLAALRESQAQAERYNQRVAEISKSWGDVGQSTALALQALQNQLPVAQAVTGAEQMRAQYAATYNNLLDQAKTSLEAQAIASKQLETSQASATSNVLRQVDALKDSTDMIRAQVTGTEASTAAAIAYRNAIKSGADATAAAALSSEVMANNMARAAVEAKQAADAVNSANYSRYLSASTTPGMVGGGNDGGYASTSGTFTPSVMPTGQHGFVADPNLNVSYRGGGGGFQLDTNYFDPFVAQSLDKVVNRALASGGIDAAIKAAIKLGGADASQTITSLYDLKNSATNDNTVKAANLSDELAYFKGQPQTIANLQQISRLQQSIDQLKSSTDSLNSTNQDLLSPYYTQDPRTSHIGFRSQGMADGGSLIVPGGTSSNDNYMLHTPVASGERITFLPAGKQEEGSSQQPVVINMGGITVTGAGNKDEFGRTMYHISQTMAKRLAASR